MSKKSPQLRFEGFTDDWEERKLGEITTSYSGGTPSAGNSSYYKGDIPFIRSGEINSSKTELFLTEEGFNNSSAKLVEVGDILYALYGATSGEVGISQINGAINQAILAIKPIEGYESQFIMQWLKLQKQKIIGKYLQGGQGNLSGTIVKDLFLRIPDSKEQKKIGQFFKQLDDTIALHQRKLDLLKEQKKGYLQKMFPKNGAKVPELRFAGFADDWEEHKLGDVIDIENGYAFKSEYFSDEEKRHIVLTPGSVKIGGGFQKDKGRYYDVSGVFPEKFIFKPGNIFITMTDLTPTAQSLGYPAIVPRDDNIYLHNQRLGKIINTTTNPEFLYTLLTTDTYHKEIVSSASGTTVKHSSVSKILDFKSAIPNIDEQKLIGSFFKELDNTIVLHQRKLDLLKEQKKGFLQNMFV